MLCVQRALGQPGGARGIHDEEIIILASIAVRRVFTALGQKIIILGGERVALVTFAQLYPVVDIRAIRSRAPVMQRRRHLGEIIAVDQDRGARIFQNITQFVSHKAPVEGDDNNADLGQAGEALEKLNTVHH